MAFAQVNHAWGTTEYVAPWSEGGAEVVARDAGQREPRPELGAELGIGVDDGCAEGAHSTLSLYNDAITAIQNTIRIIVILLRQNWNHHRSTLSIPL